MHRRPPRIPGLPDASKLGGLGKRLQCPVGDFVKFAGLHVVFDLRVPLTGVEIQKPISELGQFFSTHLSDFVFYLPYVAHYSLWEAGFPVSGFRFPVSGLRRAICQAGDEVLGVVLGLGQGFL